MTALICGSAAYDNIMVFEDSFKNHILPDKIHILNVAFLVPNLRREFGGCATNIAYNMKLLGEDPLPMATVGQDFGPYAEWLTEKGIRQDHITVLDDVFTAQAFITTDLDDNQITAFHPGAMNFAEKNKVTDAKGATIGMVSPDGRTGMIEHAAQFAEAGIPFIFDPGQGLPMFDGDDLKRFIEQATWVTVNDYEWQLMKDRTGWDVGDLTQRVEALI
ncbi:MAG: carbohydrate kinase family protein, partial [Gammaproteobacteria bacterium]|nr:carbohydrate kinase family protein [Gammaproteobacteria bacterium]